MGKQVFCSSSASVGTSVCRGVSSWRLQKNAKERGWGLNPWWIDGPRSSSNDCAVCDVQFISHRRTQTRKGSSSSDSADWFDEKELPFLLLLIYEKKETCVISEGEMTRMWYSFSPSSFFLHLSFLYTFCLARWAITFAAAAAAAAEQLSHSAQCADEKLCSLKENFLSLSSVHLCRLLC